MMGLQPKNTGRKIMSTLTAGATAEELAQKLHAQGLVGDYYTEGGTVILERPDGARLEFTLECNDFTTTPTDMRWLSYFDEQDRWFDQCTVNGVCTIEEAPLMLNEWWTE